MENNKPATASSEILRSFVATLKGDSWWLLLSVIAQYFAVHDFYYLHNKYFSKITQCL